MPTIVPAFTQEEVRRVEQLLGDLVRALRMVPGGGKVEEGYWNHIYCTVRGVIVGRWSNLPMRDYCQGGVGVEMKLLRRRHPIGEQGRTLMHPAATRSIAFSPSDPAETCKVQVFRQFNQHIAGFRQRVSATCHDSDPEVRWGVFLWRPSLDEFLYFEELMEEPDPDDFYAEYVEVLHRGELRRNLHIFEKQTGNKRYSVTMPDKGAKVQPYFDVPALGAGAYGFRVPDDGLQPIWLRPATITALRAASAQRSLDEVVLSLLQSSGR